VGLDIIQAPIWRSDKIGVFGVQQGPPISHFYFKSSYIGTNTLTTLAAA